MSLYDQLKQQQFDWVSPPSNTMHYFYLFFINFLQEKSYFQFARCSGSIFRQFDNIYFKFAGKSEFFTGMGVLSILESNYAYDLPL